MKNSSLKICNAVIQPGEKANLALPLPDYNSCTSFYMPIKVVQGKEAGPSILIFSGLEGDEFNGIEIINRLLKLESINNLKGTLIAVPIINILGLINHQSLLYEKKLVECFPGDEFGSYGERIAQIFTKEIFAKASYCIELTTGAIYDDILPQVYCDLENEEAKKLAKQFAAPVVSHVITKNNSLRETANALNIPLLVYKAGEARRFDESAIKIGVSGIKNILNKLDMISDEEVIQEGFKSIFSLEQDWTRAHRSGILVTESTLGQFIEKNQVLGRIADPFSSDCAEPIKSSQDGILVGINRNPLVFEGQNIFKIASFIDNNRAEVSLEQWTQIQAKEHATN